MSVFTEKELRAIVRVNKMIDRKIKQGMTIVSPEAAASFFRSRIVYLEHEVFMVLFLNSQNAVIDLQEMFRGTIDGASVYPREVVKEALRLNAACVCFFHNHPSGAPDISNADRRITTHLCEALAMVDIRVLDHIIFAPGAKPTSFAEQGLL